MSTPAGGGAHADSGPTPTPEPAKKEHHEHHATVAKEPVGEATLSVFVRPWAIVFVDHQRLKQTPVQGYKLPSGKHVIELVNEGKNRREKIEVTLSPAKSRRSSATGTSSARPNAL